MNVTLNLVELLYLDDILTVSNEEGGPIRFPDGKDHVIAPRELIDKIVFAISALYEDEINFESIILDLVEDDMYILREAVRSDAVFMNQLVGKSIKKKLYAAFTKEFVEEAESPELLETMMQNQDEIMEDSGEDLFDEIQRHLQEH